MTPDTLAILQNELREAHLEALTLDADKRANNHLSYLRDQARGYDAAWAAYTEYERTRSRA